MLQSLKTSQPIFRGKLAVLEPDRALEKLTGRTIEDMLGQSSEQKELESLLRQRLAVSNEHFKLGQGSLELDNLAVRNLAASVSADAAQQICAQFDIPVASKTSSELEQFSQVPLTDLQQAGEQTRSMLVGGEIGLQAAWGVTGAEPVSMFFSSELQKDGQMGIFVHGKSDQWQLSSLESSGCTDVTLNVDRQGRISFELPGQAAVEFK